jgi:CheY-like chemotaxis protein/HPt (histidine-containing phosphotransfer) domain-containing protein
MCGEISVSSTPGSGSCFSFTARLGLQESPAANAAAVENLQGISVLLVDDNDSNRRMMSGLLAGWGMAVHVASDADEALNELARMQSRGVLPRLVISDVNMPGMDGWELVWQVRQVRAYDGIQAMIMSDSWKRGDSSRCKELRIGADLNKPLIPEELQDALTAVISGDEGQGTQLATHFGVREQACCAILVVDDVEINRELLRITLEKQGHRVTMAINGQDAVDTFSDGNFDIIFMDMQMPVLDGYGAVRRIREIEQERASARTPVVAMTAYAMQGDRERCLDADMDAYLSKPARPAEILATLNQLLAQHITGLSPAHPDADPIEAGNATVAEPEQVASENTIPVFDRQELLERLGGREEMLGRFIDMFSENVAEYMVALGLAVENRDQEQLRIQAHTIKGAAGNISARRVRETASAIETHAREGRLDEATGLVPQLTEDLQAFQQEVAV